MEQEKLADLHAELRAIRDEMSKEKLNVILFEKEKNTLEERYGEVENQNEQLREINSQLEAEIQQWKVKCELLENNQADDDNESKHLQCYEEIETLKHLVEEKDDELQMWKGELRKMEDEINAIYNENQTSEETEQKLRQQEEAIKGLSEENDNLRAANSEIQQKMDAIEELIAENESLKNILRALRSKLEIQLETSKTLCKRSQRELDLKRKLEDDYRTKLEEVKRYAEQTQEMSVKTFAEDLNTLKTESTKCVAEINDFKQQVKELRTEIDQIRDENQRLIEQDDEEEDDGEN